MTNDTADLQGILRRIERLEAENRRLKQAVLVVALLAGVLLAMGQARPSRTVEADEFVLRDQVGTRRALLGFGPWREPLLTFYNEKGDVTAFLDGADAAGLHLLGGGLDQSVALEAGKDVHGLWVYGKGALAKVWVTGSQASMGVTTIGVTDTTHQTGVRIQGGGVAPVIDLTDGEGFETRIGSSDLVTPRTGETHKTSAASLVLFGKDNKVFMVGTVSLRKMGPSARQNRPECAEMAGGEM